MLTSFLALWMLASAPPASPVGRLFALDSNMVRGAAPAKPEEFEFLKEIGIGTIVSFDRKTPDYAQAESVGIPYVHIPIGYGTIPEPAQLDFFAMLRDPRTPPPYYIHCHGGKYRVGAMAALYRMQCDGWNRDSAYAEMLRLGGKIEYLGLNASVRDFRPIAATAIEAHAFDPAARPRNATLGSKMVEANKTFRELRRLADQGIEGTELQGIALGLEEIFFEIHRLNACPVCDSAGNELFLKSAQTIQAARLRNGFTPEWFQAMKGECMQCHSRYRK